MTIPHKPFKDLTDAEKGALLLAHHEGKRIEVCHPPYKEWDFAPSPSFAPSYYWRIAPEPKTPDTIKWEHVAPGFNFMARDENGGAYIFSDRPDCRERVWDGCGDQRNAKPFASYSRGTVDWKDSLVIRPGYEDRS